MKTTIYYATGNDYKFTFAKEYIERALPQITLKQFSGDLDERQTFDQGAIAQEKARAAYATIGAPILADDAGLYMDAYHQFPGFMTKFVYQGLGVSGIMKLLNENNHASLKIFLAFCAGADNEHLFVGEQAGTLSQPHTPIPDGAGNPFNYMFTPRGASKPYHELSSTEKNRIGYFRQFGLDAFIAWYRENGTCLS